MRFDINQTFDILERTPAVLDALLRGTSAEWHAINEGPETWSAIDVVGHLVQGEETDWITRAQIIREHGEARPFDPFDRFAHLSRFRGWSLDELLDRFAEVRRENLVTARGWALTDHELALRGRHPGFGTVTLRQLLSTWAVHDLNHIGQIVRVMAGRYADEVGPWSVYLSILSNESRRSPQPKD